MEGAFLSLSAFTKRNREREKKKKITFKGRFSAPKFSKCVDRKDEDDGHLLLAESRNFAKDQNGNRERETRDVKERERERICFAQKRVVCFYL